MGELLALRRIKTSTSVYTNLKTRSLSSLFLSLSLVSFFFSYHIYIYHTLISIRSLFSSSSSPPPSRPFFLLFNLLLFLVYLTTLHYLLARERGPSLFHNGNWKSSFSHTPLYLLSYISMCSILECVSLNVSLRSTFI